jgi:serine/threonine-protein kinase
MNENQAVESKTTQSVCAQCGSQFSSLDDAETFCATCLLHVALIDEDAGHAARLHRFDQYELITGDDGTPVELGRGAMGVTYKAFDTNLRCEVALKVIHPRYLADESSRARFLSEARAAAQLRHRNIASVFHLGSERNEYFYAMELVEGETIEDRVRTKGPIECATALDITLQITRALIAAGDRKFVHRDVKPSNIMLCSEADGAIVAKLIDFGLVAAVTDASAGANATRAHSGFIGTPHFASPEQFAGKRTDARSDIYSLGVTLWFMLTGKLPFDGTREAIPQQQLSGVLPLHRLKGIPCIVVELIKRMLETDPTKRPQSPAVLKEKLDKCIAATESANQEKRRRFAYTTLGAAALVIIALGASYILQRKPVSSVASEIVPEKSVAVLPFESLGKDKDYAFFAEGVQDEILTDLAQIADLKVISRTSVTHYKTGIARNLLEIGRQLGVAHVVEGSVHRSGDRVRIHAQLLDARTDRRLWEHTYDGNLSNIFAIHGAIAKAIAEQLHITLSSVEQSAIERAPTTNISAFDLYTRAKSLLVKEGIDNSKAILLPAIDMLNQAIARDPTFLDAYCLVAWAHDLLYFVGDDHTPARLALAEASIEEASRLHPEAGETHLARAWNLHWGYLDYNGALAELETAKRSLPNDEQIPRLAGYIYRRQGRWEDSARSLERAIELDPRNVGTLQQIALSYGHLGRYAEQELALDRVLAIEPNDVATKLERAGVEMDWKADTRPLHQAINSVRATNPAALPTVADSWLICALAEHDVAAANDALMACPPEEAPLSNQAIHFSRPFIQGVIARMKREDDKAQAAFAAARAEQEKIIHAQPNYGPALCVLGLIDASLGHKDQALQEGHRAVELLPVDKDALDGPLMIKYLAMIAAWAGDNDLACEQLAVAVHSPSSPSYGALKLLPWWDPLRGDPRFEQIVASLAPAASEAVPEKSIAVLPFENLSDEKEHAFFADGVQDDVLTKLAKVADLKVISRTSVMQYRGKQDLREVGRALGVSHVLEGTARRSGGKVHLNAQLVDTRTGMNIWAEEYERNLDEVFAVESELAQSIANQLRATVSARELLVMNERPTQNLIAYDLYIRAKNLLVRTGTESSKAILLSAIDVLTEAVARDPTFLEAYCLLGWAHHQIYFLGLDHTSGRLALAEAAVQAASRLRPDAGETHLARAWNLYAGHLDYNGALAELEIAHQTLPNNAQIPRLAGLIKRRQGRWKESMQNLERAVDLDPRDAFTLLQISYSYGCLRRYAERQLALERASAIEPNDVGTKVACAIVSLDSKADTQPLHRTIDEIRRKRPNDAKSVIDDWLYCALAERNTGGLREALAAAGETSFNLGDAVILSRPFVEGIIARMIKDDDKARSAFIAARVEQEKIIRAQPNYAPAFCALGLIDAALGRKEDALREGQRAVALLPVEKDAVNGPLMIEYLAMIAAWIGDKELACQQLAIVVRRPSNVGYGELKLMPYWDPLRGDPCFERLVEQAKQPVTLQ